MPASQQALARPDAPPAPEPAAVVDPPQDPNLVRVLYDGVNAVCAGDHLTVTATGGNGSYTWSPSVGLSATTGASVVAGPLVTTTYTVTSLNPATGAPTTATFVVNALQNCCPQTRNRSYIKEIPGTLFNASTGSPFLIDPATGNPYPAGTRFHLSGDALNPSAPIVLSGLAFQPPMGSVILMDGGKDLYLQDGASLNLSGVSITAACTDMWGKLWVRNTAAGIRSTFTDGNDGWGTNPNDPANAAPTPSPASLKNQLSHSLGGIEFEQSTATSIPYYRLTNVDFLHNEQSIKLWRANFSSNGANPNDDHVSFSAFDSTPAYFKNNDYVNHTAAPSPHYATYHVWFDGFGGYGWYENTFKNALFGFHNPASANAVGLEMGGNRFENIWLAAINVNSEAASFPLGLEGSSAALSGTPITPRTVFAFPTALTLPSTPQFAAAIANDVQDHLSETRGIFSNAKFYCDDMDFTQSNDPYTDFTFSQRTKQVGIKAKRLMSCTSSTFSLLHTGIELTNVLLPSTGRPVGTVINYDRFLACRRGVEVHGLGIANRDTSSTAPPPVSVSLPLSCNTFDRISPTRAGTMYGVYLEGDARVTFDPLPVVSSAPSLANKFLDYNTGRSGYYAIYNGSAFAFAAYVRYTTYQNYVAFGAPPMLVGHNNLNQLTSGVTLLSSNTTYTQGAGQVCGNGSPGLERTASLQNILEPSSPNPASDYTTLHYQLAPNAGTAKIYVRRSNDGHLMQEITLRPGSNAYQLGLHGWPVGVYVVTLEVDGVPAKASKLIVQ